MQIYTLIANFKFFIAPVAPSLAVLVTVEKLPSRSTGTEPGLFTVMLYTLQILYPCPSVHQASAPTEVFKFCHPAKLVFKVSASYSSSLYKFPFLCLYKDSIKLSF